MLIRPAVAADDLVLGELQVRAYQTQYARKMPDLVMAPQRLADLRDQAEKRANALVLVAEIEAVIVGSVALYQWGAPRCEAWIEGAANLRYLAVDAERHGRGLSGALLDAAEHQARSWGASHVCLHVRRDCVGIARLYESRGYDRDEGGDLDRLPQVFLEAYALRL